MDKYRLAPNVMELFGKGAVKANSFASHKKNSCYFWFQEGLKLNMADVNLYGEEIKSKTLIGFFCDEWPEIISGVLAGFIVVF